MNQYYMILIEILLVVLCYKQFMTIRKVYFHVVIGSHVVYILDQVHALENKMLLQIKQEGLDITPQIICFQKLFIV